MDSHISQIVLLKFLEQFFLLLFVFKKKISGKISQMVSCAIGRESEDFRVQHSIPCLIEASVDNSLIRWHKDWCLLFVSLNELGR